MKSTVLAIACTAFASICVAQNALPSCAQNCVVKFTSGDSIGGCQSQDAKCICSSPTFLSNIACCLSTACNPADQQSATDFAKNYCELSGVTNLPTAVVCTSTAASSSGSSTSSTKSSSAGASIITPAPNSNSTSNSTTANPTSVKPPPATSSKPNAGAQNAAAGVGAGIGLLALAALL